MSSEKPEKLDNCFLSTLCSFINILTDNIVTCSITIEIIILTTRFIYINYVVDN